jgi:glycosyltransferase involved in cell wall biosynthesis
MINLYIIDYFDLFKLNGLTTYLNQFIKYLPDNKITLHYIWVKSAPAYKEIRKEVKNKNITHLYFPEDINVPGVDKAKDLSCANFIALDSLNKKNIIFHFNWINHCGFGFLLKQKIKNCNTLLTKHCIPWRDYIIQDYKIFKSIDKQLFSPQHPPYLHPILFREQLAYSAIDHIICVTDFARKALFKLFEYPAHKTSVVYNGLQYSSLVSSRKKALKQKYGFAEQEKLILFAGTVQEQKGVWNLIEAFERLVKRNMKVRLIIAGNGNHSRIFETIKGYWSKVTVTGNLDKKTLYDFYQMADIGVVPSYVEQCCYTAIEMMHFKLPIIVANVDGLAEIVPDDCGLKVPLVLGETKAFIHQQKLADSILYFLNNPPKAKAYAERAKQHALQHFTAKKMVSETIKVYNKLVTERTENNHASTAATDKPLVSIILPCYNAERYIKECIDSVLLQTYRHFELLIIDDGSTDKTKKLIRQYKDKRIKIRYNEKNEGLVATVNKLIQWAGGKYIARIDADDMMHEMRIEKQVAFLEDLHNKNTGAVGSNHYVIDIFGHLIGLKKYPATNAEIRMSMLFQNPFSNPSVMFRAETLKQIKYSRKYLHAEDYHIWFVLSRLCDFANIPEYLTYYRVHGANLSTSYQAKQKESVAQLLSDQLEDCGIKYSTRQLVIHLAISFSYGAVYFNNTKKITELKDWINKIHEGLKNKYDFPNKLFKQSSVSILQDHCGIYN